MRAKRSELSLLPPVGEGGAKPRMRGAQPPHIRRVAATSPARGEVRTS